MAPRISPLLVVSLAFNFLLLGGLALRIAGGGTEPDSSHAGKTAPGAVQTLPSKTAASPGGLGDSTVAEAGDEPRRVRDALRAAGLSEELIREFVRTTIWRRNAQTENAQRNREWWKDGDGDFVEVPASTQRAVEAELRALMGDTSTLPKLPDQLAFLGGERRAAMIKIEQDYAQIEAETRGDTHGFQLRGDQTHRELLKAEYARDLQALLTPEEYDEVMLMESTAGMRSRRIAGQLDLNEAEFRQVVKLRREAEETAKNDPQTSAASRAREDAFNEQLTRLVGGERMAKAALINSRDYKVLQKAQARVGLAQPVFDEVLAQRDYVRDMTSEITAMPIETKAKREALKKLAGEVKGNVTRLLGPEVAESYFMNNAMSWLREMERGEAVRFNYSGYAESYDVK